MANSYSDSIGGRAVIKTIGLRDGQEAAGPSSVGAAAEVERGYVANNDERRQLRLELRLAPTRVAGRWRLPVVQRGIAFRAPTRGSTIAGLMVKDEPIRSGEWF
jgi:hypothetical protein